MRLKRIWICACWKPYLFPREHPRPRIALSFGGLVAGIRRVPCSAFPTASPISARSGKAAGHAPIRLARSSAAIQGGRPQGSRIDRRRTGGEDAGGIACAAGGGNRLTGSGNVTGAVSPDPGSGWRLAQAACARGGLHRAGAARFRRRQSRITSNARSRIPFSREPRHALPDRLPDRP